MIPSITIIQAKKAPLAAAKTTLGKQKLRSVERRHLSHYRNSMKNRFPHKISQKSGNRLLSYGHKWFLKRPPSAILNFKNFHIFDLLAVIEFQMCSCVLNFIKIRRFLVEIWGQFSRWRRSAFLNCRGLITGYFKNPCRTSYRSSIETVALNCLVLKKIAFLCWILVTDKQTDEQTGGGIDA